MDWAVVGNEEVHQEVVKFVKDLFEQGMLRRTRIFLLVMHHVERADLRPSPVPLVLSSK